MGKKLKLFIQKRKTSLKNLIGFFVSLFFYCMMLCSCERVHNNKNISHERLTEEFSYPSGQIELIHSNQEKTKVWYNMSGVISDMQNRSSRNILEDYYEFYPTGKIKSQCKLSLGKMQGELFTYYESGQLKTYNFYWEDDLYYGLEYDRFGALADTVRGRELVYIQPDVNTWRVDFKDTVIFYLVKPPKIDCELIIDFATELDKVIKSDTILSNSYEYRYLVDLSDSRIKKVILLTSFNGWSQVKELV